MNVVLLLRSQRKHERVGERYDETRRYENRVMNDMDVGAVAVRKHSKFAQARQEEWIY
jgi:hypothetical protein